MNIIIPLVIAWPVAIIGMAVMYHIKREDFVPYAIYALFICIAVSLFTLFRALAG